MKNFNWKAALKVAGVFLCAITFTVLAITIYLNELEPFVFDIALRDFCYSIRGDKDGFGYWVFRLITEFGNFILIGIIVIAVLIWTKCDYRSVLMVLGICLSVLLSIGLKELYMRERPTIDMRWMEELTTSFPSGHSTAAGFVYSFLIYLFFHADIRRWIKNTLYVSCGVMVPLVMFSRMILGVHYLSDVLAGVSIGIMVSCLMMQLFKVCVKYDFMTEGLFEKIKAVKNKSE